MQSGIPDEMPGVKIGSFALVRTIAHGAIGELHLATDTATGLPVALKTVRLSDDSVQGARSRDRFLREAESCARLQHPHIVSVYAAGIDGTGSYAQGWIAMEWVSGSDLTRYTRAARLLPEAVVLGIVSRAADALAHAHAAGIVHRDIKPANILVNLAADIVKLTDFGCAHLTDSERSRSGMVIGTPSYMAPEQLAGAEVDARADLYALGVVLFEMLTGRLPFEAQSLGELMAQIAHQDAPSLHALRPDLPVALERAVARALAKSPVQRFPNGSAMARELQAIASQWPQPPAPDAAAQRATVAP
jgi:serine/threonine-protein kinase